MTDSQKKQEQPVAKVTGKSTGEIDAESRLQDLQRLYQALMKDIEKRGVVIQYGHNGLVGKNPSVALLISVNASIRRLQNDLVMDGGEGVDSSLRALHQDGKMLAMPCGHPSCRCVA